MSETARRNQNGVPQNHILAGSTEASSTFGVLWRAIAPRDGGRHNRPCELH
jgi:hypothetical protein